jgi:PST family polysaccharide transporter
LIDQTKSYKQIIKSTGIFGGSQVVTILLGIIRSKVLALLLGASGLGLISIYQNILDLIRSISVFGIDTTGVREIATAGGSENKEELIETISLIDKCILSLAFLGAFICLVFSYPISLWAFGDASYALNIALLSVCTFFSVLAIGQTVILHGLRQIEYMVKAAIWGNTCALIIGLLLYFIWGIDGIIPALILMSIVVYLLTYYYRRKTNLDRVSISFSALLNKGASVFRVGFFIVASSAITYAGGVFIRSLLTQDLGLSSVGLLQAVTSISGIYLALILKSMGSDFYPRLCTIIDDDAKTSKLINEQTYIVLIVSVPLIIALLMCSKLVLAMLYSSEFITASSLLNWHILGTFFKVVSWPIAFILLAKGKGIIFFISEMLYLAVYMGVTYLLHSVFNLEAVGIAYLIAYIVYLFTIYILGIRLSAFSWTVENFRIVLISLILVLLAFYVSQFYKEYNILVGIPLFIISCTYSVFKLNKVFPLKSLVDFLRNK